MKPHVECIHTLVEIGKYLGFESRQGIDNKMYELANPDCVWYYKGKGWEELRKIARGDKSKSNCIPFVAFEVAYSEGMKGLRGSLMSLQLVNASVSIIVLKQSAEKLLVISENGKLIRIFSWGILQRGLILGTKSTQSKRLRNWSPVQIKRFVSTWQAYMARL